VIVTPQKPFDEEQLYFGRTKVDNNGSSSEKNVPHACVTNASSRGGDLSRSLLLSHHHTHQNPFETNLQTTAGKMHFFGSNRFKPRRNFATINDDKQRRRRRRRLKCDIDVVVVDDVIVLAAPVVNKKDFLCLLLYVVVCAGFCTSFWKKKKNKIQK
tara:strand:+ start:28 stop:498 length:471 start_codon:yes stop_codon:yes gene_type:complete